MPAVRRNINIATTPRTVWKALTTADGLTSWWVDEARVDGRAGGRVVVGIIGDDGEAAQTHGIVHTWRPTSHFEVAWDRLGEASLSGSRTSFQLARDGDETRLTLVHSGSDVLEDEESRAQIDDEWRQALLALQEQLDEV